MHVQVPARRRGPVPRLSADKIADAVLEIGFDRAQLTAVAQHLGVAHGALYRYIGDRNGMMATAMTRAVERFDWPELADDIRTVIWGEAHAWWSFCEQHPGFAEVLATTPGVPLPITRRSLAVAVHLRSLGLPSRDALIAVDFASGTIHNIFAKQAQRLAVVNQANTMSREEITQIANELPADMLAVIVDGLIEDPWPWFSQKLQVLINGLGRSETLDPHAVRAAQG